MHLDQAGKKKSRRTARAAKAEKIAPRPLDKLRPVVRCPTQRYNRRVREGRGFTFEEVKAAGTTPKYAATIGVAVDHRRVNRSVEGFEANVQRLKEYLSRVIVLPAKSDKVGELKQVLSISDSLPVVSGVPPVSTKAVSEVESTDAFKTLRKARMDKKFQGKREKKAREEAEKEKN